MRHDSRQYAETRIRNLTTRIATFQRLLIQATTPQAIERAVHRIKLDNITLARWHKILEQADDE